MDTLEAIRTRKSVRSFSDRAVEPDKLRQVLEAARMAPSWANLQCWRFVVVQDAGIRQKIAALSYFEAFMRPLGYKSNPARKALAQAPAVIVACGDPGQSGNLRDQHYYLTDVGLAAENLMLAAHALGLGSVFVGIFDEAPLKELLDIPPELRIVGLFPIGYPETTEAGSTPRKTFEEIVRYAG